MAEGPEVEDQVNLDDDNYSEEIDDDLDDQLDYEAAEEPGNDNGEDQQEEEENGDDSRKKQSPEADASKVDKVEAETSEKPADDEPPKEEKPTVITKKVVKEEFAKLLALPPRGSEVFVGGLPREVSEEDLRDLCEPFGDILEVKLVKNKDTGESKGFSFVAFKTKDVAAQAIKELNGKDFKGRTLRCSVSETKFRLFIGNVPKTWTEDEFKNVIDETGPGAENIELIKDPVAPSRNRGFAFVEYYNNACADFSRLKMLSDGFKLDGNTPTVTWADPKTTPDHSAAASQVKALYVKNIPDNTSSDELKQLFQRHGDVTRVVTPPSKTGGKGDFGFIHYSDRSSALKAVNDTEKYEINGQVLEVCLAKPQNEKKFDSSNPYGTAPQPSYIPHPSFHGIVGSPYVPAPPLPAYGVAAPFQQPMIYGRGPMPSGMQMVPMVLPDGRIGYVLQQPGAQLAPQPPPQRGRRHDWNNGSGDMHSRGGTSSRYDDSSRSKRHRPSY